MSRKRKDAILRSDRILVGALAIILAAACAALGAAAAYQPDGDGMSDMVLAQTMQPMDGAASLMSEVDAAADTSVSAPISRSPIEQSMIKKVLEEHTCLSKALYYEARGEGTAGEKAVAEVIYRRLNHGGYGNSLCEVIFSGADKPGCQFSFACNGAMKKAKVAKSWRQAQVLAARIITREEPLGNTTLGAINFHTTAVQPDWSFEMVKTVQIGNHIFYRRPVVPRTM